MKKAILLLMIFALYGCDQSAKAPEAQVPEVAIKSRAGIVLETIDVESYTYIRLDEQGKEVWLASTPTQVSKGELVSYSGEIMMKDFYSKTLDRTFPAILFVGGVQSVDPGSMTLSKTLATTPDVADLHQNLAAGSIVETKPVAVDSLEGGKTIAEIVAEYEQIEGQEVSLRASVTKFSANILGKNWITLQDGTGTAPENKLVVTSLETVAVGDVVVVKGVVRNNVDIGAGYNYKVLLEEASFGQ